MASETLTDFFPMFTPTIREPFPDVLRSSLKPALAAFYHLSTSSSVMFGFESSSA